MTRAMDLVVLVVVLAGLSLGGAVRMVVQTEVPRFSGEGVSVILPEGWLPKPPEDLNQAVKTLILVQEPTATEDLPGEVLLTAEQTTRGLQQAYLKDYWSVSSSQPQFRNLGTTTETQGSTTLLVWTFAGVVSGKEASDLPRIKIGSLRYFRQGDKLFRLQITGDGSRKSHFEKVEGTVVKSLVLSGPKVAP